MRYKYEGVFHTKCQECKADSDTRRYCSGHDKKVYALCEGKNGVSMKAGSWLEIDSFFFNCFFPTLLTSNYEPIVFLLCKKIGSA